MCGSRKKAVPSAERRKAVAQKSQGNLRERKKSQQREEWKRDSSLCADTSSFCQKERSSPARAAKRKRRPERAEARDDGERSRSTCGKMSAITGQRYRQQVSSMVIAIGRAGRLMLTGTFSRPFIRRQNLCEAGKNRQETKLKMITTAERRLRAALPRSLSAGKPSDCS